MQENVTCMSSGVPIHEVLKEMSKFVKDKDITFIILS